MSIKNTDRDLSKLDWNFLKKVQAFLLEVGDAYTWFTKSPVSMYSDLKRYPVFWNYDNDGQTKQLIEVALYRYHQTVKDSL